MLDFFFLFCDLQDLQSIHQNINICPKQEELVFCFFFIPQNTVVSQSYGEF